MRIREFDALDDSEELRIAGYGDGDYFKLDTPEWTVVLEAPKSRLARAIWGWFGFHWTIKDKT